MSSLLSAETPSVSVHVGPHCGCGKSFSVRITAHRAQSGYRGLKLTASMGVGALSHALQTAVVAPGRQLLHLDLSAGQPLLRSDGFAAHLAELLMLGRLGRTAARAPEEIFQLNGDVRLAIEMPAACDLENSDWAAAALLSWLPRVHCESQAARVGHLSWGQR